MLRVMQDGATSIRIEPPGEEGEGIEFAIETNDGVEYHQVKRQLARKWQLVACVSGQEKVCYASLSTKSWITPSAICKFISMHAAHPLDELAERARQSENYASFKAYFIDSTEWQDNFDDLHSRWGASSEQDTYLCLKRVFIHTIDEYDLRDLAERKLEACVRGNPKNALDALAQFALAQTHQNLTSEKIWGHLQSRGFSRQDSGQDVAAVINGLNDTYLAGIQPTGIGGKTVQRSEVQQIFAAFDDEEANNIVLLTGKAGVGKSSAIAQVLDEMNRRDGTSLSFRLDRLEASATPRELGQALRLPDSPVSALASIAKGRECLLVIDQFDAVSMASGRNSDFFDCISAMLREAKRLSNLRVLVACRKFDVDNDPRIRGLIGTDGIAQEVTLAEFDEATVREVVANLGIESDRLSHKQIKLLSLPVHLRLLAALPSIETGAPLGFQTAKELYDAFWDEKKRVLKERVDGTRIQEVADLMAKSMSERQALSVPTSLLDEHTEVVDLMASENILVKDGARVSFFHESFFDYMFARRMVEDDFDAAQFVFEQEQSLFVRSQLRQVLLHQRDVYPDDALRNMAAILEHPDIRPHLKDIVLALLGSLDDPTEDEWYIDLEPMLDTELSDHVWRAINRSPAWFDVLDSIGVIRQWLSGSDEELLYRTIWFLRSIQEKRPDRVAELVSPFLDVSEDWNQRLLSLLVYSKIGASRNFFEFVLEAIEAGLYDRFLGHNGDDLGIGTWYRAKELVESKPEMACKVVTAFCDRLVKLMRTTTEDP